MADEMNVNVGTDTDSIGENNGADGVSEETKTPTVEELLTELAKIKADRQKEKNALDKALKEKGEITKKLREKQTVEEALAEQKALEEAERAEREAEKDRIIAEYEAKATFSEIGLTGTFLEEAMKAKSEGDEKAVYSVIGKYFEDKYNNALKAKESEWLGKRPPVNVGVGGGTELTKEKFNKMGYAARVKLATENPELYAKMTS